MPRAFKRSAAETNKHKFLDARSFISTTGHWLLYGKDKGARRTEIYELADGRCANCGRPVSLAEFHWHHLKNGPGERCDCTHNAACLCQPCHNKEHEWRRPIWTSKP